MKETKIFLNEKGVLALGVGMLLIGICVGYLVGIGMRGTKVTRFSSDDICKIVKMQDMIDPEDLGGVIAYEDKNGKLIIGCEIDK